MEVKKFSRLYEQDELYMVFELDGNEFQATFGKEDTIPPWQMTGFYAKRGEDFSEPHSHGDPRELPGYLEAIDVAVGRAEREAGVTIRHPCPDRSSGETFDCEECGQTFDTKQSRDAHLGGHARQSNDSNRTVTGRIDEDSAMIAYGPDGDRDVLQPGTRMHQVLYLLREYHEEHGYDEWIQSEDLVEEFPEKLPSNSASSSAISRLSYRLPAAKRRNAEGDGRRKEYQISDIGVRFLEEHGAPSGYDV